MRSPRSRRSAMRICTPPTRRPRIVSRCPKSATRAIFSSTARTTPAQALAEQVLAQAKAGKDFGELAKQYSQDPGSAKNGGDLGWAERGSFVAPFSDALFGMSVGEIKGPVKTQFGYHIIRLDEVAAGKGKSFEEARADLEAQLRRTRATDRFGDVQEQLQTKLAEPGADLTALAQQYHLQQGDVPSFVKGAGGAPFGPAPQLQEVVFADPPLAAGRIGGPVLLGDDRLVIVKVLDHHPPQEKPLARCARRSSPRSPRSRAARRRSRRPRARGQNSLRVRRSTPSWPSTA